MSGFGGFGGFGQNTQQPQQTGFGGFGQSNTNTGFGSTGNTGFGAANPTGGGIFGNTGGQTTGFGNSGGFGSTQTSAFGAKPGGFGAPATTSGGLFGNNTAAAPTSGFGGGFGAAAPSTSAFGGGATGGSIFGAPKPTGFGSTTGTGFGSTQAPATTGFGGASTGGFGAPQSTALGGATADCQGTGAVQFQPFVEKEPASSTNQQNSFQSISFQQPYQKWSPEELRLADYSQGRRYGTGNQPGAFGASTGFGGFGQTAQTATTGFGGAPSTGLFGSTGGAFGATSQPQSTGFGAPASGGLFGAPKPATGLFGAQPAQQTQPTGGLFGGGSTGGFGGASTTGGFGQSSTPSLFGAQNNAAKPGGGFSFGSTPATNSTGFGSTPAPTTAFGGSGGLFGSTQQQSTPFGQQPAAPATNAFGGFGAPAQPTNSLFGGNTAQKPATTGLFGQPAAPATGSLFGGTQQPAANAFGSSNAQSGGLFGNKPATAPNSLFGSTAQPTNNTGSGLFGGSFGNNQAQAQPQQQSTGLFGGLNTTQQNKPTSLFGNTQPQQSTGLFGSTGGQQGSLFGSTATNQQQPQAQNSLFGGSSSLFGNSQQSQQGQQSQSLTASVNDRSAYGNIALFANLADTANSNPGPLATPLRGSAQKKAAALPIYKLNPASSTRYSTPAKRGFGFSYSTYGSPGSASSTSSTPGTFNSSLLGGSLGRGLSKSMSTSSLRQSYNTENSILAPGAFSSSPNVRNYGSTGSLKKLVINKGLRTDLFTQPSKPAAEAPAPSNGSKPKPNKRVSFPQEGAPSSPLKQVQNGNTSNGIETQRPEMQQVKSSTDLVIIPEDEPIQQKQVQRVNTDETVAGDYWMKPSKAELERMPARDRKIAGLTVGRENIGKVTFLPEVDLSKINLDDIMGKFVVLVTRSCTVYPENVTKPLQGHGLNVPSEITLMHSWPRNKRSRANARDTAKHEARLKQQPDTEFRKYNGETGEWTFRVQHFTTYGLDYDDDDSETDGEGVDEFGQSTLSAPPDTPTPKTRTPNRDLDDAFSTSQITQGESDPEDTFQFRNKNKSVTRVLPGAFDDEAAYEDDDDMEDGSGEQDQSSFLDNGSVGSQSDDGVDDMQMDHDAYEDDESVSIADQEMAGSYPHADNTAEPMENSLYDEGMESIDVAPGTATKERIRALKASGTPLKRKFTAGNDWTDTLKTTLSPQKQNRALLKSLLDPYGNTSAAADKEVTPFARSRVASNERGFANSMDLLHSLWGQPKSSVKVAAQNKGFKWPYSKRSKTSGDMTDMKPTDRAFHDSMKPSWGPDGTLVYAAPPNPKSFGRSSRKCRERDGLLTVQKDGVVSENRDVRFAKFSNESAASRLQKHIEMAIIDNTEAVPFATLPLSFNYSSFVDENTLLDGAGKHENLVWQLASVLWDDFAIPEKLRNVPGIDYRLRKDKLSVFWENLVNTAADQHVALARSSEEKAIAALSGHKVEEACGHLLEGKDYRLAVLVSQIGGREATRKDIREQLSDWKKSDVLSEFSQPIRAIYELLAGNVCVCDGAKGAAENRIETFVTSKRFGLDWRQAFGLRLWYGTLPSEAIETAVEKFANDVNQDFEPSWPLPWYLEQKIEPLWDDECANTREDLLWCLLKIYCFADVDIGRLIRPENSQLSPLDSRLSWQLGRALSTTQSGFNAMSEEAADQATLSFASQLTNEGSWVEAVFVLLHLFPEDARRKAIRDHLAHHAGYIGSPDSQVFTKLTQKLKIPDAWIWEAKALYMRSVKNDSRAEVDCLIMAGLFEEAHRVFTKDVAPQMIVECDYTTLRKLLDDFKGMENSISEWNVGGQIYNDFLDLHHSQKAGREPEYSVLQRLLSGLPAVVQESRHAAFMETVAMEVISAVVAKAVIELGKKSEKARILDLPLTEDNYLKHTVELSLGYYRDVMSGAR